MRLRNGIVIYFWVTIFFEIVWEEIPEYQNF